MRINHQYYYFKDISFPHFDLDCTDKNQWSICMKVLHILLRNTIFIFQPLDGNFQGFICLESLEYKQQIRKCGKTEKYQEVRDEVREVFLICLREMGKSSLLS